MNHLTRRSLLSGAAALGLTAGVDAVAEGQLVWKSTDWKLADFQALVSNPVRVKQVYDVVQIGGGRFLNNVKNSLNGLEFGFGVPSRQIKIAVAMHGPANMLNYDDFIWSKYEIGAWLNVTDPETGKPAVRNLFLNSSKAAGKGYSSPDPNSEDSMYQDTSMQALRARGVQFMCCHTATEEQARILVRTRKLTQTPEDVVKEMLQHTVEGTLVVASMVAAIALLQADGHYTYITV
jgi:intracellular sulfur oxidation DsrE/DsrF family protein